MDANNLALNWRRSLLDLLDEWIFAALDRHARCQGWEIRRPAPFIRVYRNPAVGRCRACAGEGFDDRGLCRACLGSGRGRP
ncbi:hypothetical protein [Nonomuraea soli]|uniref:Uncharacterized protein n=1 Tax=Nonomuraea soli TaxID=1032476 RepID=A0A7W0CL67_9ACTN|nr:hypothetical protein [Nonomuraea soli]MBA2892985.1 hypothetical protein [Nonomuraea soli]